MMELDLDWKKLPDHIIVDIFQYLSLHDRYHASLVSQTWNTCFRSQYLWRDFNFIFTDPSHERYLKIFPSYGCYLKNVTIFIDQSQSQQRTNACNVLKNLGELKERSLRSLKIKFLAENPIFYSGKEFISGLLPLLSAPKWDSLRHLDLSGMTITLDDCIINRLSENHQQLQSLNIINNVYICTVGMKCIQNLVQRCRKLQKLCLFYYSLSEEALLSFAEKDRLPLATLVVKCRRQEKYGKDICSNTWQKVVNRLPEMRVTLIFDYTCPLHKVSEIMKQEIPVSVLRLETFTYIYDEVKQASLLYNKTLTKLVLNTPLSRNAPELNKALVELSDKCQLLSSIHVFCILEEKAVNSILEKHPKIKENGTYTLKYADEPAPWIPGIDCGEDE